MKREPNKVLSARGQTVDFELLRVKQELTVPPTTFQRETKNRRRRKLSERGAALAKQQVQDEQPVVETVVTPTPPEAPAAPKIVRKKATKE